MKTPTPVQLAATRPQGLRDAFARMPEGIAPAIEGLSEVVGHYITAIYFTDCGDEGEPPHDAVMAPVSVLFAVASCAQFLHQVADLIPAYEAAGGTLAQLGHDFWLTRNRRGAGFWDRDNLTGEVEFLGQMRTLGEHLSGIAHDFGETWTEQGDNGLLYLTGGK